MQEKNVSKTIKQNQNNPQTKTNNKTKTNHNSQNNKKQNPPNVTKIT